MSTNPEDRAWVEVDASAMARNFRTVASAAGTGVAVIPMVKADAYGLGVEQALPVLEEEGPRGFGVATVEEGIQLRKLSVRRPVLVFSPVPRSRHGAAVEHDLTLCLSDASSILHLAEVGGSAGASFQLEVDTGMGRAGVAWQDLDDVRVALVEARRAGLSWTGCYSHLHSADEAGGLDSVREQARRFEAALAALPVEGRDPGFLVHLVNSAGIFRAPELVMDAVRPGIFLYGGRAGEGLPRPEPVAAVRARVVHVREAAPGTTLGYGATHMARTRERWATVAIGYGDGLPRELGNRGHTLVRGRRAPIIGRISMDMTVVDISGVSSVEVGDTATFMGSDGSERITLEEVAELAGTINYDILTGLGPRLPRRWNP